MVPAFDQETKRHIQPFNNNCVRFLLTLSNWTHIFRNHSHFEELNCLLPVNLRFSEDAILWIRFKVCPAQSRVVFAPAVEINTRTRKSCTFSHIHENIGQKTPLFVPH